MARKKKIIPSVKITSPSLRKTLREAMGVKRLPSLPSLSTQKVMGLISSRNKEITKEQTLAIKQGLKDERSYQKQIKSYHPYKKAVFGEEWKQVHIRAGKINKFITIPVQKTDLEKQLRVVQRQYGIYSHQQEEQGIHGQGKVRVSKAKLLYKQEGEQGVRRWLSILSAKANNTTTDYNSQDLQLTLDNLNNLVWVSDNISMDKKMEIDGLVSEIKDGLVTGRMSFDDKNTLKNMIYTIIKPETKQTKNGAERTYKTLSDKDVDELIGLLEGAKNKFIFDL